MLLRPAAALLIVAALSAPSLAETQKERFRRLDTDGDRMISFEEHAAGADAAFRDRDADGDGVLTVEEYAASLARETPGAPKAALLSVARCFFRIVDGNGDGTLSLAEMRAFEDRVFRWLAGEDGRMTPVESLKVPPPEVIPQPVCN